LHYPYENYLTSETEDVLKKTINFRCLESHISELFEALANEKIPFYNIPLDSNSRNLNYAAFISNLSVFEWAYELNFKEAKISAKRKIAIEAILGDLEEIKTKKAYTGKKSEEINEIIKHLTERIEYGNISLFEKIKKAFAETKNILEAFIKQLYHDNQREFKEEDYKTIAESIAKQRNDYAHGHYENEENLDALFYLIIIEWLNHSLILRYVGYSTDEIYNIINFIFNRNFVPK
jgi:hypothetical protein